MRLLSAVRFALPAALPARAAGPSWTGQWDTRRPEGGAHGAAAEPAGPRPDCRPESRHVRPDARGGRLILQHQQHKGNH